MLWDLRILGSGSPDCVRDLEKTLLPAELGADDSSLQKVGVGHQRKGLEGVEKARLRQGPRGEMELRVKLNRLDHC